MLGSFFRVVIFMLLMTFIIVGVAFLTVLERKASGCIHSIRKGPNRVPFIGLLQPLRHALNLFPSEQNFPLISKYLIYYFLLFFGFYLSLFVWLLFPYLRGFIYFELGLLFFFLACILL